MSEVTLNSAMSIIRTLHRAARFEVLKQDACTLDAG
jgi:hypothetical protein